MVLGDRVAAAELGHARGAEARGDLGHEGLDPRPDLRAHCLGERAHRAAHGHGLRQHVERIAGLQSADRNHGRLHRIEVARHDALQGDDHVARHQHAVDGVLRQGRVAAAALDGEGEAVGGGHDRAGPDREGADRHAGDVVHPVDRLDPEPLHQAVLDHRLAAAAALLGRLEDHHRGAIEVTRLGEVLGRPEQHGRVPVMAAGVHLARHGGAVGQIAHLLDRQSVHVGAQADGAVGGPALPPNHTNHPGAADAGHHFVAAEGPKPVRHEPGRAIDVVEQLGMGMEIVPPRRHRVGEVAYPFEDGHGYGLSSP